MNGILVSRKDSQSVEIQEGDSDLRYCDPATYPLQKKGHSLEFLREIAYLRPRTNTFGAIFRIRHHMAYAIHKYFNDRGFYYFHTPIITASDAEGAGSMFEVTTLDMNSVPKTEEGKIDFSQDFFGRQTNLTVSGQLDGACAGIGCHLHVRSHFPCREFQYTPPPSRVLMIEPEVAFNDNTDNMNLAEDF